MSEKNRLLYAVHCNFTDFEGNFYPEHPWNSLTNFVYSSYNLEHAFLEAVKLGEQIAEVWNQKLDAEDAEFTQDHEDSTFDESSEEEEEFIMPSPREIRRIMDSGEEIKTPKIKTFEEIESKVQRQSDRENKARISRGEKQTRYQVKEFPKFNLNEPNNGTVAHYIVYQPFDRSEDRDPKIKRFDPNEKYGDYDPSTDHMHIYVQTITVPLDCIIDEH
jgi:Ni/Co efflux regulator RcnB